MRPDDADEERDRTSASKIPSAIQSSGAKLGSPALAQSECRVKNGLHRTLTFEETRAHLGVETQRQWSDLAIERETPCLFGLYSLVALIGRALHEASPIAIRKAAWYPKAEATFSDVLAAVRRECWGFLDIRTSQGDPSHAEIPRVQLDRLLNAVCYSH